MTRWAKRSAFRPSSPDTRGSRRAATAARKSSNSRLSGSLVGCAQLLTLDAGVPLSAHEPVRPCLLGQIVQRNVAVILPNAELAHLLLGDPASGQVGHAARRKSQTRVGYVHPFGQNRHANRLDLAHLRPNQ